MDTIESRVKEIVSLHLCVIAAEVKLTDSFIDNLGADSLDEVELVMALEDEFKIDISDEDANNIKTVQQAIDYVTANVPA